LNGDDCDDRKEPPRPDRAEKPAESADDATDDAAADDDTPDTTAAPDPVSLLAQNCQRWAKDDQCNKNPAYMLQKCSTECDSWCDQTACDSRVLEHWRKCLSYARNGTCYSHTAYMKTACAAFCPKNTYPPQGFNKHGGPSIQYGGNPLQVPVQEPARVLPGVQVNAGWDQSSPVWNSPSTAADTSDGAVDALTDGSPRTAKSHSGLGRQRQEV
jgi:hypothetical protein